MPGAAQGEAQCARQVQPFLGVLALCVLASSIGSPTAHAGTSITTIQPTPSAGDDSFLREDNLSENNDNDPTLRVRATADQDL